MKCEDLGREERSRTVISGMEPPAHCRGYATPARESIAGAQLYCMVVLYVKMNLNQVRPLLASKLTQSVNVVRTPLLQLHERAIVLLKTMRLQ